jgi:predicted hotdog family 3-hydroxylacyl-ACP dehydratase
MSLLEAIEAHDDTKLRARATSHRAPGNPLRRGDVLPIAAAMEYGAQAAAAHGALAEGGASPPGFLAAVRGVSFGADRLDDVAGALEVSAERIGGSEAGVLYAFSVKGDGRVLAEGRLTVAFAR